VDVEAIRRHCLGFPHTAESVQWGADLCFKVDGKLFAVAPLEVAPVRLSFKCTPESFAELCERSGIIPAPYMARAQWVALQSLNAVPDGELCELLAESYRLVWERLTKKLREELASAVSIESRPKPAGTGGRKTAAKTRKSAPGRRR
jgi:predicted DNA-binding protein (MmcQ/YjbR family)